MDNQIYVAQLNVLFLFCKLLFEVKKIDTLKKKFILMFFGSVYPTRPSDTVNKYAIYPSRFPYFISGKIFQMVLGLILQLAIPWLEKPGSQMPCLVLFEIECSLEFFSTNPPFLSLPSNTKIQTANIWC